MIKRPGFPLRLYQQTEPAMSAKGSLSLSYSELTRMTDLLEFDPALLDHFANYSGGYPEIFGSDTLRKAIAGYLGVAANDVIVTNGIDDAMPSIYEALLEPGDHVSLLIPTYDPIRNRATRASARIVTDRLEYDNGDWRLTTNTLKTLFSEQTRVCALNVPHNPTGWYPNSAELACLKDHAQASDTIIIADEVYAGMPQEIGAEAKSLATLSSKFISVGSLTKVFGLPGLRIGWIACTDPRVITQIKNARTYAHCYVSALSEMAAVVALENSTAITRRKIEIARKNLDRLVKFIAVTPSLELKRPAHGTVCMARFDSSASIYSSASDLCAQLLHERRLILIDNTLFGDNAEWVRFGFGIERFGSLLSELNCFLQK